MSSNDASHNYVQYDIICKLSLILIFDKITNIQNIYFGLEHCDPHTRYGSQKFVLRKDYIRLSQNIQTGYAQAHNAKLGPEGFLELLSLAEYGKKSTP